MLKRRTKRYWYRYDTPILLASDSSTIGCAISKSARNRSSRDDCMDDAVSRVSLDLPSCVRLRPRAERMAMPKYNPAILEGFLALFLELPLKSRWSGGDNTACLPLTRVARECGGHFRESFFLHSNGIVSDGKHARHSFRK